MSFKEISSSDLKARLDAVGVPGLRGGDRDAGRGVVAQLPVGVVPPAANLAVRGEHAGVVLPGHHVDGVVEVIDGIVEHGLSAQLVGFFHAPRVSDRRAIAQGCCRRSRARSQRAQQRQGRLRRKHARDGEAGTDQRHALTVALLRRLR